MKTILVLYIIFPFSFLYAQATNEEIREFVKEELNSKDFPNNTQLSIGFISGDSIFTYGVTKKRKWKQVVNDDLVFEIGSISKVFTSFLLTHCVERGLLKLSDTIQHDLDVEWKVKDPITYEMLSNHTSGLPRLPSNLFKYMAKTPRNPYVNYDKEALISYLEEGLKLESEPGKEYAYSNVGAGLLGYLISEKLDMSYEKAIRTMILDDLGMASTSTELNGYSQEEMVQGLNISGSVTDNWDFDVLVGAGGIKSTVLDMVKFMNAQLSDSDSEIEMLQKKTFETDEINLALGWHIIIDKNYLWHNGSTGGYRSSFVLDPNSKTGVIILSNVSYAHPDATFIDQLVFELIDKLM
jgi:CubicO group peptidase (beta-lactamase class C family)